MNFMKFGCNEFAFGLMLLLDWNWIVVLLIGSTQFDLNFSYYGSV